MDKGTLSNVLSASLCGVGLCLPAGPGRDLALNVGLFAFGGGITNSLAVKMLFDRIPGLVGSGVIPARFREIRATIKSLVLDQFFSEELLRRYIAEEGKNIPWQSYLKRPAGGSVAALVERQWEELTGREALQPIVDAQLEKLMDSSIGGMLMMVGTDNVKPAVTQFLASFAGTMKQRILAAASRLEGPGAPVELDADRVATDLRRNVDRLLARKLEELSPEAVKRMMERVIRHHLGWLVVWGNVLGGALGLVPLALERLVS